MLGRLSGALRTPPKETGKKRYYYKVKKAINARIARNPYPQFGNAASGCEPDCPHSDLLLVLVVRHCEDVVNLQDLAISQNWQGHRSHLHVFGGSSQRNVWNNK